MEKDGQKIWNHIISSAKVQLSTSVFKTWFAGSYVSDFKVEGGGGVLTIALRNSFLREQVEKRYLPTLYKIKEGKGFGSIELVFTVGEKVTKAYDSEPLFTGVAPQFFGSRRPSTLSVNHTFENFVVGASNNIAYLCSQQVVSNLGQSYNPLLIFGPTGVGKTHLLQAIGNRVNADNSQLKVVYATSEKFTNDYIESLGNRSISAFRNKYRSADVILVDDVHFFAGKESTQDEFSHTFNELQLSGRQIILACDRHPRELPKLKDRLVSRFLGGMTVNITYPDVELKVAIIKQKCKERNVELTDEIVNFIASACEGGIRELEGLLIAVLAQVKIMGNEVDVEVIKNLVGNGQGARLKAVSPEAALRAVSKYFGVDEEKIKSGSRKAQVNLARQILMYILRKDLMLSYEFIGGILGGRDHSTVIHGVEKVENIIVNNSSFKDEILRIKGSLEA